MVDQVLAERLDWQGQGTALLTAAVSRLDDAELAEPSRLPGWSRAHVIGHLSRNADALRNLLTWARTGVETPMYPNTAARDADIESTAALPPAALRADLIATVTALEADVAEMTDDAWAGPVRTRQGRAITGAEVPWMRCREVWVHAVDLDAGIEFTDFPSAIGVAMLTDACAFAANNPATPGVRIRAIDADFELTLGDGATEVARPLAELLGWVLGREDRPDLPALPAWL